ncbi:MAG: hypothetical protein JXQ23_07530 [Clostridia bacterium]|nr:hypothetical protein [Clostridia bacterium]
MNKIISSTEIRKNWSQYIDEAIRFHPVFFKRNRDMLVMFSSEQIEALLDQYKFNISITRAESGIYTGTLKEISISFSSHSMTEILNQIVSALLDYASDYMDNSISNIKSKKEHFPYILKILNCINNNQNIKDLLVLSD